MEQLDGDGNVLSFAGKPALRDVVQFVPFNKYKSIPDGGARLAAEVLAEIPAQLTKFMASKGIVPNPALAPPAEHAHEYGSMGLGVATTAATVAPSAPIAATI
jgi:hypothetical protein